MEEGILLSLEEYQKLCRDSAFLNALEAAGVDNWEGYEQATEIFNEQFE